MAAVSRTQLQNAILSRSASLNFGREPPAGVLTGERERAVSRRDVNGLPSGVS